MPYYWNPETAVTQWEHPRLTPEGKEEAYEKAPWMNTFDGVWCTKDNTCCRIVGNAVFWKKPGLDYPPVFVRIRGREIFIRDGRLIIQGWLSEDGNSIRFDDSDEWQRQIDPEAKEEQDSPDDPASLQSAGEPPLIEGEDTGRVASVVANTSEVILEEEPANTAVDEALHDKVDGHAAAKDGSGAGASANRLEDEEEWHDAEELGSKAEEEEAEAEAQGAAGETGSDTLPPPAQEQPRPQPQPQAQPQQAPAALPRVDPLLARLTERLAEEGLELEDLPTVEEELVAVFIDLGFNNAIERMKLRKALKNRLAAPSSLTQEAPDPSGREAPPPASVSPAAAPLQPPLSAQPPAPVPVATPSAAAASAAAPLAEAPAHLILEEAPPPTSAAAEEAVAAPPQPPAEAQLAAVAAQVPAAPAAAPAAAPTPLTAAAAEKATAVPAPAHTAAQASAKEERQEAERRVQQAKEAFKRARQEALASKEAASKKESTARPEAAVETEDAAMPAQAVHAEAGATGDAKAEAETAMVADEATEPAAVEAGLASSAADADAARAVTVEAEVGAPADQQQQQPQQQEQQQQQQEEDKRAKKAAKMRQRREAKTDKARQEEDRLRREADEREEQRRQRREEQEARRRQRAEEEEKEKEEERERREQDLEWRRCEQELRSVAREASQEALLELAKRTRDRDSEELESCVQNALGCVGEWHEHTYKMLERDREKWDQQECRCYDHAWHLYEDDDCQNLQCKEVCERGLLLGGHGSFLAHVKALLALLIMEHVETALEDLDFDEPRALDALDVGPLLARVTEHLLAPDCFKCWRMKGELEDADRAGPRPPRVEVQTGAMRAATEDERAKLFKQEIGSQTREWHRRMCQAVASEEARSRAAEEALLREEEAKMQACPQCGATIERSAMKKHKKSECPQRLVECPECRTVRCEARRLQSHLDTECLSRHKPCKHCGALVKLDSLKDHAENECPKRRAPCPQAGEGCGWWGPHDEVPDHLRVCPYALAVCPHCWVAQPQHAMQGHRCNVRLAEHCVVCTEKLADVSHRGEAVALFLCGSSRSCEHIHTCLNCAHAMQEYNTEDLTCPLCRAPCDAVVATPAHLLVDNANADPLSYRDMGPDTTWFIPPSAVHFRQDAVEDVVKEGKGGQSGIRILDKAKQLLNSREAAEVAVLPVFWGKGSLYACGCASALLCVRRLLALVAPARFRLVKVLVVDKPEDVRRSYVAVNGGPLSAQFWETMTQSKALELLGRTQPEGGSTGASGSSSSGRQPAQPPAPPPRPPPPPAPPAAAAAQPHDVDAEEGFHTVTGTKSRARKASDQPPPPPPRPSGWVPVVPGAPVEREAIVHFARHWGMHAGKVEAALRALNDQQKELAMRRFRARPDGNLSPVDAFGLFVKSCKERGFAKRHRLDDPWEAL